MTTPFLFLDGQIVRANARMLKALTPGVLKGRGVFETLRVYEDGIFAFDRHWRRFSRGLKILKLDPPFGPRATRRRIEMVLDRNHLHAARVRLTVWRDVRGTHTAIVALPFKIRSAQYLKGFKAAVARIRVPARESSVVKSIAYGPFRRAYLSACRGGFDEAILLNTKKELAEGSRTNLFFIRDGVLRTPSRRSGCLDGITKNIILHLAKQEGIPSRQNSCDLNSLKTADEAFVTNALLGVMPLTRLNKTVIGDGGVGPLTRRIQRAYRRYVRDSLRR